MVTSLLSFAVHFMREQQTSALRKRTQQVFRLNLTLYIVRRTRSTDVTTLAIRITGYSHYIYAHGYIQ